MERLFRDRFGNQAEKTDSLKVVELKAEASGGGAGGGVASGGSGGGAGGGGAGGGGAGGDASNYREHSAFFLSSMMESLLEVPLPPSSSDEEEKEVKKESLAPAAAKVKSRSQRKRREKGAERKKHTHKDKPKTHEDQNMHSFFKAHTKDTILPFLREQWGVTNTTTNTVSDTNACATTDFCTSLRNESDDRSDANSSTDTLNADTTTPGTYRIKCPIPKCSQILIISSLHHHVIEAHGKLVCADTALDFINTISLDGTKHNRKRRRVCRQIYELRLYNNGFDEHWLTQIPVFLMTRYVTLADIGGIPLYHEPHATGYLMLWFVGINFRQLPGMCVHLRFMPHKRVKRLKLYCVKMPQDIINVYVSGAAALLTSNELQALRPRGSSLIPIKFVVTEDGCETAEMGELLLTSLADD